MGQRGKGKKMNEYKRYIKRRDLLTERLRRVTEEYKVDKCDRDTFMNALYAVSECLKDEPPPMNTHRSA